MHHSLEPRLSVPDIVSQLCKLKQRDEIRNGKPGFEATCIGCYSTEPSILLLSDPVFPYFILEYKFKVMVRVAITFSFFPSVLHSSVERAGDG